MAFFKSVFVLVVVLFGVCRAVPSTRADAHNLYACVNYANCHAQLYQEYVEAAGKLLQYVERNVVFPNSNTAPNSLPITCIEIQDMDTNGNGGYYTITNGGLTLPFVTVNLKSQRSRGLRFNVRFFYDVACPLPGP